MDREDEQYAKELIDEYNKQLKDIQNKIKDIWKQVIEDKVYSQIDLQYYANGTKERTFQLRDKVTSKIENGTLYVYANTSEMEYYSFGRRNYPVSPEDVLGWVNTGHTQSGYEGANDNFRDYRAREFLVEFYERVKKEYPDFEIELIDNGEIV